MTTIQESGVPEARSIISANSNNPDAGKPSILQKMKKSQQIRRPTVMSVDAWLEKCRTEKTAYMDYADRMLLAIGEPEVTDTKVSSDERERRFFGAQKFCVTGHSQIYMTRMMSFPNLLDM